MPNIIHAAAAAAFFTPLFVLLVLSARAFGGAMKELRRGSTSSRWSLSRPIGSLPY
jgi:hypothetical protein